MILDQIRIEKAKDDLFDPTSLINNKPYIYVVGKNKWSGYKACATYQNMNVYLITEEGECGGAGGSGNQKGNGGSGASGGGGSGGTHLTV